MPASLKNNVNNQFKFDIIKKRNNWKIIKYVRPSKWVIVVLLNMSNFTAISWWIYIRWNGNDLRVLLDQHAKLNLYSASSMTQHYAGRHVAPLWHIILIPSQTVCVLMPFYCVLSGEITNTNVFVFVLAREARTQDLPHSRRAC